MVHSAVQSSRGGTSERLSSIRGSSVLQSSVDYSLVRYNRVMEHWDSDRTSACKQPLRTMPGVEVVRGVTMLQLGGIGSSGAVPR
jgi:hypothetical protein